MNLEGFNKLNKGLKTNVAFLSMLTVPTVLGMITFGNPSVSANTATSTTSTTASTSSQSATVVLSQSSTTSSQTSTVSSSSSVATSSSSSTAASAETATSSTTAVATAAKEGWVVENGQTFYYENNQVVTGEQKIDGYYYLFAKETGVMQTGFQNLANYGGNKTVYYDPATGHMLYGVQVIEGRQYNLTSGSGALVTGLQSFPGSTTQYFVESNGAYASGEKLVNGYYYLFDKTTGAALTGIQDLTPYGASKRVYYNQQGQMQYGEQLYNGHYYLFAYGTGAMQTGLQDLRSYGADKTVYYDPTTGQMLYGTVNDIPEEQALTFNNGSGSLVTGWYTDKNVASTTDNGDGSYATNQYYVDNSGTVKGEYKIEGSYYFFRQDGFMLGGIVKLNEYEDVNKTVYYSKNGQMQYGEQLIAGYYYFFNPGDGAMKTGFTDLRPYGANKTVYYDPSTGRMLYGEQVINGQTYTFAQGTGALVEAGFRVINGNTYYYKADGSYQVGEALIDGSYYLFDQTTGIMQVGFQHLSASRIVYYDPTTGKMQYGEQHIGTHYYLFEKGSGTMQTGFKDLDAYGADKTVYYDPSTGWMLYGLQNINGASYYFDPQSGASTLTVDISSYQSWMNQNDFYVLKANGVRSVVVKLTEGTSYVNPYAANQIRMAQNAGLKISVYTFARLDDASNQAYANSQAIAEANYLVAQMRALGLPANTPVIYDVESSGVNTNYVDWTVASQNWANTMQANGYNQVRYYASASWAGLTNGSIPLMDPSVLGANNMWIAQYPTNGSQVYSTMHTDYGAWQFSSAGSLYGLSSSAGLDFSFDYKFILG